MADDINKHMQDLLLLTMRDYSQHYWANNWVQDLEYDLWAYACGDVDTMWKTNFGSGLRELDRKKLSSLAINCNGWYTWPSSSPYEKFVTLKNWNKTYSKWKGENLG